MVHKVGYLVPEFPAQTHIFFWREILALRRLGMEPILFSTMPPPASLASHRWSREAADATSYLVPTTAFGWTAAAIALARTGRAWRCLRIIAASGCSLKEKARLCAAAAVGARLAAAMSARGIGHVHAHSAALSADIALFATVVGAGTFSLTLHGPLSDYGCNQQAKWACAAFGIVITEKLRGELLDRLDIRPEKLTVVPMGVDLERLRRIGPYRPYRADGPFRVFSCGRLNRIKGHRDLIQAVAQLKTRGLKIHLEIAGEDERGGSGYRRDVEQIIDDLDVRGEVSLLGAVSEERVIEGLGQAHCFALASHHEPLGVAIMEAMAMELPTIATFGGGVRELVTSDAQALLVPPQDVTALAEALWQIARMPTLASRLAAGGRARVEEAFSSDRSALALIACMEAIG